MYTSNAVTERVGSMVQPGTTDHSSASTDDCVERPDLLHHF